MNLEELIVHLVNEVAWRTENGSPDFTNPAHVQILEQVLNEQDFRSDEIYELIANINSAMK